MKYIKEPLNMQRGWPLGGQGLHQPAHPWLRLHRYGDYWLQPGSVVTWEGKCSPQWDPGQHKTPSHLSLAHVLPVTFPNISSSTNHPQVTSLVMLPSRYFPSKADSPLDISPSDMFNCTLLWKRQYILLITNPVRLDYSFTGTKILSSLLHHLVRSD